MLGAVLASYALARPRMLRYGATEQEIESPYPGREVIPGGRRGATMATTLDAPPSEVWPWLVQMGCDRAGWYSWDRLDNGGTPSAEKIHPGWQEIAVGDRFASLPDGSAWFEVAALERERFLGLRATLDLRGRPLDPGASRPRFYMDSLWGFLLEELPGGRTRLINSGYDGSRPRRFFGLMNLIFWEPAHWIMQTRQWTNLRRRLRSDAITRRRGPIRWGLDTGGYGGPNPELAPGHRVGTPAGQGTIISGLHGTKLTVDLDETGLRRFDVAELSPVPCGNTRADRPKSDAEFASTRSHARAP